MILDDEVTITLPERLGSGVVTVPAYVGRPKSDVTASDGVVLVTRDRLLVIAEPGTLPPSLTAGSDGGARVTWQGTEWEPVTNRMTHRVHGEDHHDSVTLGRAVY